jgi:hypothetical protein
MKIGAEHPYYLGAVAAWLLFGCGGWMISGNANSGMIMGLIAGGALVVYGLNKARDYSDDIEKPTPRVFAVSEFEAFATIKDALPNNIDDMKMKYMCRRLTPHTNFKRREWMQGGLSLRV